MNEQELTQLLKEYGYEFLSVHHFKNCDRIRWQDKYTKTSWTTRRGIHLENLTPKDILNHL